MSLRWMESHAPIVDKAVLLDTLQEMGVAWSESGSEIVVEAAVVGAGLRPMFRRRQGAWVVRHTDVPTHMRWAKRFAQTLAAVEERRRQQLAAERRRQEELRAQEERRQLVERRRVAIAERATALGYSVTEKREADQVRLVLVRRTY